MVANFQKGVVFPAKSLMVAGSLSPPDIPMKKLALVVLLLVSLRASGDFVVVEQITEARRQPETITIKVKGDKCRKDLPNRTSAIYDVSTGDVIRIDHASKHFKRISGKTVQAAEKIFQDESGGRPAGPPRFVDTGKTEKVDGHVAEIYTAATPGATYTFWVTKDYPDYASLSAEMKKFRERHGAPEEAGDLSPDASQLDGIVIKTQSLTAGGELTTIRLISAKTETLEDSEFQPPAGYEEVNPQPAQPVPGQPAQ